jgi:hypothetical protein
VHVQSEAGELHIGIDHAGSHVVRVTNISGALVRDFSGTGSKVYTMNSSEIKAGVYLIRAKLNGFETSRQRVVVF